MKTDNRAIAPVDLPVSPQAPAVEVEGIVFSYHGQEPVGRPALNGVSFAQDAGEMIGIMGASGAGKSTLAKCLNRIIPGFEDGDFHGIVRIGGRSIKDLPVHGVAAMVGMVFQDFEAQLFSTNVAHEVAFAMEQVGMSRADMNARITPALDAVGLSGFEHRDPTSLSGGEKQRLAIASVLALRPAVIVLDEPTTDLDPEGRSEVFALIRQLRESGLSMIVIEHEAEELRECDRLLIIREGEIFAQGPPGELMSRIDLFHECGIRPPSLDHLMDRLGIHAHAPDVDHAEAIVRRLYPKVDQLAPAHPALAEPDTATGKEVPPSVGVAGLEPQSQARATAAADGPPLVEVKGLRFAYPDGPPVLSGIDLQIPKGEFLAIVGQNGSGKTTLAKHIVGLLNPTAGVVMLNGVDRRTLRTAQTAQQAGYVFQNPDHQIFAATVEDEVAFGPRNFGLDADEVEKRCSEVLHAVGLEGARKRDPFLLSKGERQRLAAASVLALRPQLLILDEPTTGLDYREQRRMMALVEELNRSGIAIVIITHTPWLVAEYSRRVVLMRKGRKLFDGGTRTFFDNEELLRTSSFRPPEITDLGRRFGTLALTVEEFARWLEQQG